MSHRLLLQATRLRIRVSLVQCRLSSNVSLGVRESLPPDHTSNVPPTNNKKPSSSPPEEITDQEWEIRTGRAINVIQQTLPELFSIGLVTSIDKRTGEPRPPSTATIVAPVIGHTLPEIISDDAAEPIYSPKIRLCYTPPEPLSAPFPKTFKAEGLSLYLMSSVLLRHTFNMLYTDVKVVLSKVTVTDPTTGLPYKPPPPGEDFPVKPKPLRRREKSLFVGMKVHGASRISGSPGEWQVNSTYTFSPLTGLVLTHIVNSIHPAPHQAVYESLRSSLGNVFGFGDPPAKPQIEPATTAKSK